MFGKLMILTLLPLLIIRASAGEAVAEWKRYIPKPVWVGDIVCRRCCGYWSSTFVDVSTRDKRFSHAGVVVAVTNGAAVIHSEADDFSGIGKVHEQDWVSFCKDAEECAVYRYAGDDSIRCRIADCARARIGVSFDPLFDLGETNMLYCSEMVRLVVNEAVCSNLIGTTIWRGREVVAIDDLYRNDFIRVYDSRQRQEMTKNDDL